MMALRPAFSDGLVLAWRYLKRVPRIPELAIFAIIQSIMFVLLFAFVFGGAIPLPGGGSYREFLMPGIFAQTITFAVATTAIGMADDMGKGIIDRFRSLPMARSAVLTGRTFSDVIYNGGILIVLMVAGFAVGWTVHTGIAELLAGIGLLLLFTFAMSWVGVWLGLSRAQRRGRPAGRLHDRLPDHFRLERLRAAGQPARLPAPDRRVEPGQRADCLAARPVGQSQPVRRLAACPPSSPSSSR